MRRPQRRQFHNIYKISNKLNGKYYVGMHSTDDIDDGYFGSGKYLRHSINKHGKENHEMKILEWFSSRNEAALREAEVVNEELLADPLCMNLKFGGEGGWCNANFDVKARNDKCRQKFKQKLEEDLELLEKFRALAFQNLQSDESLLLARKTKIEKFGNPIGPNAWGKDHRHYHRHSEESKERIRNAMKEKSKGEGNSQYGTCWICNEIEAKKIKKEELQTWLDKGWRKGRK